MKVKVQYVLTETWVEEYDSLAVAIENVGEWDEYAADHAEIEIEGTILSIEGDAHGD